MNIRNHRWTAWLTGIALAVSVTAHAALNQQEEALTRIAFEQHLDTVLPLDAVFVNDAGETVTLGSMFSERPVILVPVYYNCPMLCGLIVNGLLRSIKEVSFDAGDQFDVVVFSFDPRETADLAKANKTVFLEEYGRPGAERGVHFLVGEEDQIRRVTDAIGFKFEWVEEMNDYAHAAGVLIATPEGRLSRYFFGILYNPRDMHFGLMEASQNRIGSLVDRLLLFCYHYDPSTGEYGLLIHRVINAAAVTTASVLGLFVFVMLRAEKRRNRNQVNQKI